MELVRFRRQQHLSAQHYLSSAIRDTSIDDTVHLLADRFRVPMVQVNVLDADRQVTVAAFGAPLDTIDRADSLCTHVVSSGRLTMLADINPIPISAAHIKTYVGVPLTGREGLVIGTLCLLDTVTRRFTDDDLRRLRAAARIIEDQLELIRRLAPASNATTGQAAALITAIDQGQIVPYYQPIVDLVSGSTCAVEALARWHHPQRGLLDPDVFIPIAEDSDIIVELDLAMLVQAAAQLRRWQVQIPALRLNINLSARHVSHPDCIQRLRDAVETAGADPASITFELTETSALAADPADRAFLAQLRQAGFTVVLDDFGTGYAAAEKLLQLPIDGIKIDRALSAAMHTHLGGTIVGHIVGLATDLDLSAVIEGLETGAQVQQALSLGARYGQGYLWAPPLSAEDMTGHLTAVRRVG